MTIKFELPTDNESVLKHIGTALTNIAAELRGDVVSNGNEHRGMVKPTERVEPDTTVQQYESLAKDGANVEVHVETVADDTPPPPPVQDVPKSQDAGNVEVKDESAVDHVEGVELDINGLPWDKRIHSANKSQNSDGSWRNRRQGNFEGTSEEWKEYIATVEAELKGAINGVDDTPPPPSPVVEQVQDDTPPPPPPVVEPEMTPFDQAVTAGLDVPPPPPMDEDVPARTFPELMKLVTSNAAKGSVAKVQAILLERNLGSLQTLNTARPDMVSTVFAELNAQLGE